MPAWASIVSVNCLSEKDARQVFDAEFINEKIPGKLWQDRRARRGVKLALKHVPRTVMSGRKLWRSCDELVGLQLDTRYPPGFAVWNY